MYFRATSEEPSLENHSAKLRIKTIKAGVGQLKHSNLKNAIKSLVHNGVTYEQYTHIEGFSRMPPLSYYTIREDQKEDELPLAALPLGEEDENAIRLLTFREPSSHILNTLSLDMHRSSTSEAYIALSYEWGLSEPEDPFIHINNRPVQIRKNLHEAILQISEHYARYLKQRDAFKCPHRRWTTVVNSRTSDERHVASTSFREDGSYDAVLDVGTRGDRPENGCYEDESCLWTNLEDECFWARHDPPRLWIDALCINQHDHREKSDQVGRMGTIFSSAKVVLAWIGLSRDDSDDALRILSMPSEQVPTLLATVGLTDRLEGAILSLCERTYWHRVWILQEIFLAKTCVVMCGRGSIKSESLETALFDLIHNPDYGIPSGPLKKQHNINMSAAHRIITSRRAAWSCTLGRWLLFCLGLNFQATVPHDYIYALLSISSSYDTSGYPNIEKAKIVVDYDNAPTEVYRQLLQAFRNDPISSANEDWLLKLAQKMGISNEEAWALLGSESRWRMLPQWTRRVMPSLRVHQTKLSRFLTRSLER